ncbi:ATP-binding protein [Streptomyces sp. CBMA29]|uniref:ATP-binding protein n=1 Tax=Streptomyces sp. CBMA29 TaxID=1896314 RepID=UPI00166217A2|nr:ATP-binding protein [Streptomyces sp. CBMA29]MBD0739324.1 hypothetical protein [Streptomyces sp. CBMA29]
MTTEPPLWISRLELPLEPAAVHAARAHTRRTLSAWEVKDDVIDDAELIVSELATNSVQHVRSPEGGGSHFVLTLCRLPTTLRICLADEDPRPPVVREPTDDGTGGRGLFLVSELSDGWGYRFPRPEEGEGKAVLAELRLAQRPPGAAENGWDAGPVPPIPAADPFARVRAMSGPLVHT